MNMNGSRPSSLLSLDTSRFGKDYTMTPPLRHSGDRQRTVRYPSVRCVAAVLFSLLATSISAQQPPAGAGTLRPGDIVVVTHDYAIRNDVGTLVKVDPSSGAEETLSDFADPSQGPVATPSTGPRLPPFFSARLVIEDATAVFVNHSGFDGFFHVDPATGVRTTVSDSGVSAIEHSGDFLMTSQSVLIRMDRSTGTQTIVSDFHDPAQGPVTERIGGAAVEKSGRIIVRGFDANSEPVGLFAVDPSSGVRTLLSDFGDPAQGPVLGRSGPFLIDHSGDILLLVPRSVPLPVGPFELYRVDPVTGMRVLVSGFCLGVPGIFPLSLAVEETGDLLVVLGGDEAFPHQLLRFDSTTGVCGLIRRSTEAVGIVPTPLVNGLVSLSVSSTLVESTADDSYAPAGVFRITATLTNESAIPVRNPFFRVADLSAGNVLVTGDRPPDLIREGGKGTRQTPDVGDDGVLSPGESVDVEFGIGLNTRAPFMFFVDVFGEADVTDGSQ